MLPTLVLPLGPKGQLRLAWSLEPHGFSCSVDGGPVPISLCLDVRPQGRGFGPSPSHWSMTQLGGRGPKGDPVIAFRDGVTRAFWEAFRGEPDHEREKQLAQEGTVRGLLQAGLAHALALLDPTLRELVRPFHRAMRWPVYEAVAGDPSGRLGQLARSAPGVLCFALTHAAQSDPQGLAAARAFREAVVQGVPLRRALPPLLEDWSLYGARRHRRARRWRRAPRPDAFAELAAMPKDARARRLDDQQVLLRRASPRVGGGLLWLPPPLEVIPEDIPRAPMAQLRWFKTLKRWVAFTTGWEGMPPEQQRGFVRWLSAHAVEVSQLKRTSAIRLFDHVRALGRPTPRTLSVTRLVEEVEAHEQLRDGRPRARPLPEQVHLDNVPFEESLAALVAKYPERRVEGPGLPVDLLLPNPVPASAQGAPRVVPLGLASQLRAEGQFMGHCVARYLTAAAEGQAWFFAAEAAGMRLTIQVHRDRRTGELALGPHLGHGNRAPTPEATALVRAWWARTAASLGQPATVAPAPPPLNLGDLPF